jgi:hypothetical protein
VFDVTDTKHIQRIARPMYFTAAILVLFPILELIQATSPFRPSDAIWRVGAMGLLARSLVTPILALVIAYGAAVILEQPRVLRTLTIVAGAVGAAMGVGLILYALDALQVRTQITPQARATVQLGFLLSLVKFGVGLAFLGSLAVSAWRTAAALTRSAAHHAHTRPAPEVLRRKTGPSLTSSEVPVLAGSVVRDDFHSVDDALGEQQPA